MHPEKIISVKKVGKCPTMDISVRNKKHVYYANGIATSNSHACAYGKITLQAMYLKCHFTTHFMKNLLNGEYGLSKESKVGKYVEEARYLGINILPVNVKTSDIFFEVRGKDQIEFGMAFVKGVSPSSAKQIIKARDKVDSFADFLFSINFSELKSTAINSLINAGAFDHLGTNRDEIIEKHMRMRVIVDKYKKQQERKSNGVKLRSELSVEEIIDYEQMPVEVLDIRSEEQKLDMEFKVCDAFLSDSPMAPFRRQIREYTNSDISDILDGMNFSERGLIISGMITEVKEHIIKKGKYEGQEMAFINIVNEQRNMDVVVFSETYAKFKEIIEVGKIYIFKGCVKETSFILEQMALLSTI